LDGLQTAGEKPSINREEPMLSKVKKKKKRNQKVSRATNGKKARDAETSVEPIETKRERGGLRRPAFMADAKVQR